MTDIGDDVALTTSVIVDGQPTDPTDVVLTVTDPDGAETTPLIDHPAEGSFEAIVGATAAGRWRFTWTTTDPTGVEHGYFDVAGDPPPPGRLDPLATISDLEDRIGPLTEAQALRAPGLLRDASAKVRGFCRQNFDRTIGDVAVVRPNGGVLELPQRPVLGVSAVAAIIGDGRPDVPIRWTWDGTDQVSVHGWGYGSIEFGLDFPDFGCGVGTYRVRYDHGYASSPDDVVAVVCDMVNRTLTAPSMTQGMVAERIGNYNYQLQQGAGSPGPAVRLTQDDKDALIDAGYRRTTGSIQVRAR